jgi:positive regulator of sigma E activity
MWSKSACEKCDKRNGCWSAGLDRYERGPSPLAFIEDSAISADDGLLSELDEQDGF